MGRYFEKIINNNQTPKFKIGFSKQIPKSLVKNGFDIDLHYMEKNKMEINEGIWTKYRNALNPYELIGGGRKAKNLGLEIIPSNRAFFKLWEVLVDFRDAPIINMDPSVPLISAHLAEGPGAFIEATVHRRSNNKLDKQFAITLKSDKDINLQFPPELKKKFPNLNINFGKDGTGNLFNIENIIAYQKNILEKTKGKKAMLVTADGGFEVGSSVQKEQLNSKLLFAQILAALHVQDKKGHFVLKAFSLETKLSIDMLYMLKFYYKDLFIHKPWTSRPSNSERYIVAVGFKGISSKDLEYYRGILKKWEETEPGLSILEAEKDKIKGKFIARILETKIEEPFIKSVKKYSSKKIYKKCFR